MLREIVSSGTTFASQLRHDEERGMNPEPFSRKNL
jgi:hypothetical protein